MLNIEVNMRTSMKLSSWLRSCIRIARSVEEKSFRTQGIILSLYSVSDSSFPSLKRGGSTSIPEERTASDETIRIKQPAPGISDPYNYKQAIRFRFLYKDNKDYKLLFLGPSLRAKSTYVPIILPVDGSHLRHRTGRFG